MALDPYHIWLGIPPNEQPPDHYRLLGIQRFESDPDVISNAADQRMVFLRQFQSGENAEVAAKLLNEVAAARVCLLSPENGRAEIREEYNRRLRRQIARLPHPRPITPEQVHQEERLARVPTVTPIDIDKAMITPEAPPVEEPPLVEFDFEDLLANAAARCSQMKPEGVPSPRPTLRCRECHVPVSSSAKACPQCGAREPTAHAFLVGFSGCVSGMLWVILAGLALLFAFIAVSAY